MDSQESLVGKKILIGLTYMKLDGEVREQLQLYGTILNVEGHILAFERADGQGIFTIPFDGDLEPAQRGAIYKLRSSGEAISDADFLASFTIHPPKTSESSAQLFPE